MAENVKRQRLRAKLLAALENDNLYYDPPESVKMNYPAIVYRLHDNGVQHADGKPYIQADIYECTVIGKNDDELADCRDRIENTVDTYSYVRSFERDNLHHHVYRIYQF